MERDAFLARVRNATATADLPAPPAPGPAGPPRDVDPVASFVAALTAIDGHVHRPDGIEEIPDLVVSLLRDAGSMRVISWEESELPAPGVLAAVAAAGIDRVETEVPAAPELRLAHQAGYALVDAGVTGATAGFAASGSIVLTAGPGRPRMASLIPTLHIALLPIEALYPSVADWAAHHAETALETSNLVFVTGPSRTGDIEMKLNLGVHGPRTIHVVLVPPS